MRAFLYGNDYEKLEKLVLAGSLAPRHGPSFGIPEEILWVLQAFTTHMYAAVDVHKGQLQLLQVIDRGADLEDVWPTYARKLVDLYNDKYVSWARKHNITIADATWATLTELAQLCKNREQMFQPQPYLQDRILAEPGKQPFWLAMFEAVTEDIPKNCWLAISTFRKDPVIDHTAYNEAVSLFISTLTFANLKLDASRGYQGSGARSIRLRNLPQLP